MSVQSPKFYQTLNLHPRSMKNHGKHRRAGSPAHRNSADGAGAGAGRPTFYLSGLGSIVANDPAGSSYTVANADPGASLIGFDVGDQLQIQTIDVLYGFKVLSHSFIAVTFDDFFVHGERPEPKPPVPPVLPYAGIKSGEIIGWRLWWVVRDPHFASKLWLTSFAHKRFWEINETIEADLNECVVRDEWSERHIWGGTYAFATIAQAMNELKEVISDIKHEAQGHYSLLYGQRTLAGTVVLGRIKMWGDVIEHETGYRAQYAKLLSLDDFYTTDAIDFEALKQRYGV